jgi:DNA invertase Pin-like site-specific DNA recombinase
VRKELGGAGMMKSPTTVKAAIYCRVSTNQQTTDNQSAELIQVALNRGWTITGTYLDHGISGSKDRSQRAALDQLLKDATRGKFDTVMVWSIDRLGRSLQHLITIVNDLRAINIDLYIHQQALDTRTPSGQLCFSIFGALAEYERELICERVRVGLDRAKRSGVKLGRPTNLNDSVRAAIVDLRGKKISIRRIAAQLRIGTGTVYQVLGTPA